jgi:hypothetical protein
MEWLSFLGSAASGGILGGILSGVKMFAAYKQKKMDLAHEIAMAAETRLNMDKEMELATIKGTIDMEIQETTDDSANLRSALEAESQISGTSQWVNDLRGSTRPILTYILAGIATVLQTEEFVFMAMTAVTFWFGDRPPKKR